MATSISCKYGGSAVVSSSRWRSFLLGVWVAIGGIDLVMVNGLAVGSEHACVVLDNGSLKCFGQNTYGQLGLGDTDARGSSAAAMGDALDPVDIGSTSAVVAMAAGDAHTCVILDGGSLKCFGKNNKGQLGLDDTNHRGDEPLEMGDNLPAVDLGENRTAVAVSAEGDRTCVILDTGNVRCWGDGQFGALGTGSQRDAGNGEDAIAPIVSTGTTATAIGEGPCIVTIDGDVKCWGKGYYGKNGQGDTENIGDEPNEMGSALPTINIGTDQSAFSVTGGRDYVCTLTTDGLVKCWGAAEGGQLGTGSVDTIGDDEGETESQPIIDLGSDNTAVEITAGKAHACALLESGGLKCWGRNFYGNLGLGDFKPRGHEVGTMGSALPEVDLGEERTVLTVGAGQDRTCAILDDGSLKCWGNNDGGVLGLGDSDPRGLWPNQMGNNLPAVSLGTNRTAVPLTRADLPTPAPTPAPTTLAPTATPTAALTDIPTAAPTATPTSPATTRVPTPSPAVARTPQPSGTPTSQPSDTPTSQPTGKPTPQPRGTPTPPPTTAATPPPTPEPTQAAVDIESTDAPVAPVRETPEASATVAPSVEDTPAPISLDSSDSGDITAEASASVGSNDDDSRTETLFISVAAPIAAVGVLAGIIAYVKRRDRENAATVAAKTMSTQNGTVV